MAFKLSILKRYVRYLRRKLPPWNFLTIHLLYFLGTCLLGAIIIWASATPSRSISFTDSLFLAVSAMTEAGLNTVNLSTLNTFQQTVLFVLILIGSAILVSAFVVRFRKAAFESKFRAVIEQQRQRTGASRPEPHRMRMVSEQMRWGGNDGKSCQGSSQIAPIKASKQVTSSEQSSEKPTDPHGYTRFGPRDQFQISSVQFMGSQAQVNLSQTGLDSADGGQRSHQSEPIASNSARDQTRTRWCSLCSSPWFSKNSKCPGLKKIDRDRLGGNEYRAVCLLAWIVPAYYILWQLLACLGCGAWVAYHRPDTTLQNGLNPWWVGAFNAVSAFNNSGMSLLDDNMMPFQDAYYLLITMSVLILAGNTCYPVFLRLIIWCIYKIAERFEHLSDAGAERVSTLRFLLKHPRRCYTLLFPAKHTWWLLTSVIMLNGIDWLAFGVLSIDNSQLAAMPANVRVIDGLFQAIAVRSGGFYVVAIPNLRISLQFLYVIMMYISVYPLLMTVRTSNVYEEGSIGVYSGDAEAKDTSTTESPGNQSSAGKAAAHGYSPRTLTDHLVVHSSDRKKQSQENFVRRRLRDQLAHDVWWMALALFLILIIEESQFRHDPAVFSVFNFIFEIISAYGCVGLSTGVPWESYSFSGTWHTTSKLILCAVMLRGRHRGLPVAIDKAVLLPGEQEWEAQHDENAHMTIDAHEERRDDDVHEVKKSSGDRSLE